VAGEVEVAGDGDGCGEREGDAEGVEVARTGEVEHEEQTADGDGRSEDRESRWERSVRRGRGDHQEHRAEELDEDGDADRQPFDGGEVAELRAGDADDAEGEEPGPRPDQESAAASHRPRGGGQEHCAGHRGAHGDGGAGAPARRQEWAGERAAHAERGRRQHGHDEAGGGVVERAGSGHRVLGPAVRAVLVNEGVRSVVGVHS